MGSRVELVPVQPMRTFRGRYPDLPPLAREPDRAWNVVDSSGWIEYLSGGPNAAFFRAPIEDEAALLVPTLSLFEVYRHLLRHAGRDDALQIVAAMRQGTVVDLDDRLALAAAELSVATHLEMADSVMLATARAHGAHLWTQDADFDGLEDVRLKRKA